MKLSEKLQALADSFRSQYKAPAPHSPTLFGYPLENLVAEAKDLEDAATLPDARRIYLDFCKRYTPLGNPDTDPTCILLRKVLGLPPLCPHCRREM